MSAKILKAVISILAFPLLLIIFHKYTPRVSSATNHVVISEIQVGGITATDEFVELYNPTSSPVDMEGWRLTKKTSTGNQSNLVSSISGIIPAHGYFLIAHPDYDGTTTPDLPYSAASNSISGHNSVILYNDAGTTEVDKVGMGTAMDFEGASTGTPQPSTSTERKASSSSTMESMAVGGDDEFLGNGEDTNNNYNDFWARDIPQPQNTNSPTETPGQPAPTPTSGPTPTEGPTPTQSPTPTDTPSPTPEPTETPTPTPAPTQVILISEIQVGGTTSTDEFVELYNPTDSAQDLSGWKIMKKTAAGTENQLVVNLTSGSIASHGYFLAAHTTYDGVPTADVTYSEDVTVSANNTVLLYDNSDNLIDKVGMGSADDFEGSDTASSPANDRSVERKANSESTKTSMETGGTDEFAGNGEDTDDNDLDFVYKTLSDPQNTSSPTESPGVGPSPTPTPVPTQSPSPTPEPTETPTPTPAPPQVILISEIQIAGTSSTDEFVELYNPNNEPVSLSDWRLTRKTQAGQSENESNLVSSFPEETVIAAHGYYLISHANYDGAPSSDLGYTASTNSIASNNTVLLYSDSGVTLVDKVGMGEAVDSEISTTIVPSVDESVERKASVSSTQESMGPGGSEETAGNGYDTNNNNNDFIQRAASDPQNSTSTSEPSGGAPTPTPTTSPTPEPTESPSPTPTEPTPSPQPTPTPTPGPSSIKRVIGIFLFPGRITVCYLNYEITRFGVFSIFFPRITCERIY